MEVKEPGHRELSVRKLYGPLARCSGRIVAVAVNVSSPAVGLGNTPRVYFDFTRHLMFTRSLLFISSDRVDHPRCARYPNEYP